MCPNLILRRARLVVTLLLVLSAIIASTASTNLSTPVQAVAPTLSLNPTKGPFGLEVRFTGSGYPVTDTICTVTGKFGIVTKPACAVNRFQGTTTTGGESISLYGSFTVGNGTSGQYVIRVYGCVDPGTGVCPTTSEFAEAIFYVTAGPKLVLSGGVNASGPIGTHVNFNVTQLYGADQTCSVSSPGSGLVTAGACAITSTNGTYATGYGSFTVGQVTPGQHIVQVTGALCLGSLACDFAQAIFNVTYGPRLVLTPTPGPGVSNGPPASGPIGTHVNFVGYGFLPTDYACTVSGPIVTAGACVIRQGNTTVTGSFTVGNVLPGQYVVTVVGTPGFDNAAAIFNVTTGPQIVLNPSNGIIGDHILVSGTGFLPFDTTCTIVSGSSNAFNPILPGSQACVTRLGSGIVDGSFIIGNVPPGQYVIQANGNQGDSAQAILTVNTGLANLTLFPTNATNGVTVTFRGTGFSVSDTGCVLLSVNWVNHSPLTNNNLITSPTCSIVSPQVAQGSFVVGPYATTDINWTVQVKGTPVNDIPAMAVFNVTASIVVTPTSGTRNTVFTFTGSGFSSTAITCKARIIPPFPTVPPTLPPACYLSTNLGQVSGSVVAPGNVTPGTYAINVGDNEIHNATGMFTIGTPSALIVLNPSTLAQGQPVGIVGVGFNPNDTYCQISAAGSIITNNPLWNPTYSGTPPVCQISGGYASASFTVSNQAVGGYYLITLTGWGDYHKNNVTGGDFASNFLGVNLASTITSVTGTTTTSTKTVPGTTTTTSVATSYSYSTTTYSTTGILFTTYSNLAVNTVSGLTTTTITQSTSTSQTLTTVTVSTTTEFTTVSCGPLPCGYAVGSGVGSQGLNAGSLSNSIGLLAVLLLLVPMLLRRLLSWD